MSVTDLPVIDAAELQETLTWRRAIDALATFVSRPQPAPAARSAFPCAAGEVLLMPAESTDHVGVKLISLGHDAPPGVPRAQGIYALFDARTLSPIAMLDAAALTAIRTAAVSALAVDRLASPDASRLVVFGTGPQSVSHAKAIAAIRPLESVVIVGRRPQAAEAVCAELAESGILAEAGNVDAVADADIVACCTASPEPLFDSGLLGGDAIVVAVGSHHPDRREVDSELVRSSFVVVESRESAGREAGDILMAGEPEQLIDATLAELVSGEVAPPDGRRLFKSVGEAWEDLALASAAFSLTRGA